MWYLDGKLPLSSTSGPKKYDGVLTTTHEPVIRRLISENATHHEPFFLTPTETFQQRAERLAEVGNES